VCLFPAGVNLKIVPLPDAVEEAPEVVPHRVPYSMGSSGARGIAPLVPSKVATVDTKPSGVILKMLPNPLRTPLFVGAGPRSEDSDARRHVHVDHRAFFGLL